MPNYRFKFKQSGYEFGGSGSCKGDSGGPMIIYDQSEGPSNAKYIQIGIVQVRKIEDILFLISFHKLTQGGIGTCGSEDFPSIYVRVAEEEVLNFIEKALNGTVGVYDILSAAKPRPWNCTFRSCCGCCCCCWDCYFAFFYQST